MRALTAIAAISKKAGLFGLFVWLALAGAVTPGFAQKPSLLEQLEKGFPIPAPRKSLGPPLRVEVKTAEVSSDKYTNEPVVVITMAPQSSRMFHELTLKYIGRRLVLRIDGNVVTEPIIREEIKGGVVQISGSMTVKEAADMAARVSKGEAKIEVEPVSD
jgi:hypothetical protein